MSRKKAAGWLLTGAGLMSALIGIIAFLTRESAATSQSPTVVGLLGLGLIGVGIGVVVIVRVGVLGSPVHLKTVLLVGVVLMVALVAGVTAFYQHSASQIEEQNSELEQRNEELRQEKEEMAHQLENHRQRIRQLNQTLETRQEDVEQVSTRLESLRERTTSDGPPVSDEDCVSIDPDQVTIEEYGDQWRLVEPGQAISVHPNREEAVRARDIVRAYGFRRHCFVGRPDPSMTYWLFG